MRPKPFTSEHPIRFGVGDIEALRTDKGAMYLFGLSSGAVIALTSSFRISITGDFTATEEK
jgi:hypothetical protein